MINVSFNQGHSSKVPRKWFSLISFTSLTSHNYSHSVLHIISIHIRYFWLNKILKMVLVIIFFFVPYFPEIAKSKYDIQIDFDIQIDVPNYNHNVSSKMQQQKSPSLVNQKLLSRYGISPKYKARKSISRSLSGLYRYT